MRRTPRVVRGWFALATLAAFVAVGVAGAPTARAHAVLLSTSPSAGAVLEDEPQEVVLTFNEAISGLGAVVRVTAPSGVVSAGSPRVVDHAVRQTLTPGAGGGSYRVDWHVTSADGHPVSSSFTFDVAGPAGTEAAPPATTSGPPGPDHGAAPSVRTWGLVAAAGALALLGTGVASLLRQRRDT